MRDAPAMVPCAKSQNHPPLPNPDDSELGRGTLPDDLLADLPCVSKFDPFDPAQTVRLRLILMVSRVKGQTFSVCLATDAWRDALATFATFPTHDEVSAAVAEHMAAARTTSGVPNPVGSSSEPASYRGRLGGDQQRPGSRTASPI